MVSGRDFDNVSHSHIIDDQSSTPQQNVSQNQNMEYRRHYFGGSDIPDELTSPKNYYDTNTPQNDEPSSGYTSRGVNSSLNQYRVTQALNEH